MYSVVPFYQACQKHGVSPIIGTELYMAKESRDERPKRKSKNEDDSGGEAEGGGKINYHLTALAENNEGYKNLIQLSSRAFLEGYYYKPRCLVAGQEILTPSGYKRIEDIEVGDSVLTHKGRFRSVTQTMRSKYQGTLYGISLNNRYNRTTWVTHGHPVLMRSRDGSVAWVEAQDVIPGRGQGSEAMSNWNCYVAMPRVQELSEPQTKVDLRLSISDWHHDGSCFVKDNAKPGKSHTVWYSDLPTHLDLDGKCGRFMGLWLAEGHASENEVGFTFNHARQDLVDFVVDYATMVLGLKATTTHRPERNVSEVRLYSTPLSQCFSALLGRGASNKHIPEFSFAASFEFQSGLFYGVLEGDGSQHDKANVFGVTSPQLIWGMRTLGASVVQSFGNIRRQSDDNPEHSDLYVCNFSIAGKGDFSYRRTISDAKHVWRPVSKVDTKKYDGYVYNIEVEDDHSYVSDFALHNCDWELLNQHSKGVIVTSGCLGGQVLQALLHHDTKGAEQIGGRLQDIFGRDNFFIEIQDHGIPAQKQTFQQLIDLAKTLDAPLLATNDSHYTHREGAVGHDSLLCVQTKTVLSDPDRFKFESDQHYLKSAEEMRYLFREIPSSCDNTLWIAERAKVEINFNELHLPEFPIPDGFADADAYLADLVLRGAAERWDVTDEVISRLVYELRIIQDMGFASYFLIVWDLCKHARENNIRVGPGRGSAAGAAVAYALQITEIDPLKHGLLFERFLNPSRISMPDIDLDLSTRHRDHMIEYCAAKYGQDHVAQIITFSQIKARAAVRDSARVLGVPYATGDKISKALPPAIQGRDAPLAASFDLDERFPAAYAASGPLRALADTDPEVRKVISIARGLEGLRRSDGVHAAAVVVSDKPITEYVPIQRKGADEPIVTQYEMHAVEELGLLKMDFLGLKNLDIIDECLRLMANSGIVIEDINQIPLDDQPTFDLLRSGNTTGVFQLESRGMQDLLKRLRPTKFGDVAAVLALYRPGPMGANMHNDYADRKNRKQAVSYYYPAAEEILQDTYGLMIYQEDVMRLSQQFAGYTLPEADNLRKAMGKKLPALMAEHNDKFVNGAMARGYDEQLARHLFGVIDKFADYGFAKSHAFGYGLIAYQTAYLKANYPTYYMAALCTYAGDISAQAVALAEAKRMDIPVRLPSVNHSYMPFTASPTEIRVGLGSILSIGEKFAIDIVRIREQDGPYKDVFDFCFRMKMAKIRTLTTKSFQMLSDSGAFDEFGFSRMGLSAIREDILKAATKQKDKAVKGQISMFDQEIGHSFEIPEAEYSQWERLGKEKENMGLYVSGHPMDGMESWIEAHSLLHTGVPTDRLDRVEYLPDETTLDVVGVVTSVEERTTRAGDKMANVVIEDQLSSLKIVSFAKTWKKVAEFTKVGRICTFRVRVSTNSWGEKAVVMLNGDFCAAQMTERVRDEGTLFRLYLPDPVKGNDYALSRMKGLLLGHRGPTPVALHYGINAAMRLPDDYAVKITPELVEECRLLFNEFVETPASPGSPGI